MLDKAVLSIIGQEFFEFEFLVVDDGTTDPLSQQRLAHWAQVDRRVRILWEPHRGLTASLNRGLADCRTEFVARQDADDWSAPQRLAAQVSFLDAHPELAVCGSNAWLHQENDRRLWQTRLPQAPGELLQAFPLGNPMVHGSTLFRREAAETVGRYREALRCSQDYDFFWRLAEQFGAANLSQPLYHYRYASGSISAGKATEQLMVHRAIQMMAEMRRKGVPLEPSEALQQASAELAAGSGFFRARLKQADHIMLAGRYLQAAKAYFELLSEHPASAVAWMKLARLGIFCGVPALREASFQ